ncbi:MAG: GFA family protein [Burkholderiales bacterium]|nr:GFA family protein [Burkholderiales bacterium]
MTQHSTGGCLCGAIRYTVDAPMTGVIACHCSNCRKASGAGASHNIPLPASALTFTRGTPKRFVDTAASGNRLFRFFCAECGSSIYSQRESMPQMVVLKAGTLDDAAGLALVMNIWTDSALPWMPLDPAVERHPRNRPVRA